jgi:flagellar biosynthesis/type III secretory pathway M-ring protein FliF/YscJ
VLNSIEEIARYIIYAVILLMAWFIVSPLILPFLHKRQTNRRYRGAQKDNEPGKKHNKFILHLQRVIYIFSYIGDLIFFRCTLLH